MSASRAWRPEDEALLSRLEDEEVLERLWAATGDPSAPPHRRASGLVREVRAVPGGALAVEQAARGDLGPLARLVNEPDAAALTPALAHHLALWHARGRPRWSAGVIPSGGAAPSGPASAPSPCGCGSPRRAPTSRGWPSGSPAAASPRTSSRA
ncbi:MAG: hypothetical protein M5U28_03665 [Sandaracinaceae bacterium]|nr:hypothetical protein [Sandaracinaceae bacterium]